MAVHAYLTVKGEDQGEFKGACDQEGHVGEILIHAFDHAVRLPHDNQSGEARARRVHEPFRVTKTFDGSSPLFYNALKHGEIVGAKLKWYRIRNGMEEHYFTMELQNAQVVEVKPYMKMCLDPAFAHYEHMEEIAFTYQHIHWTWEPDGVGADDDWKKPSPKK